jgi:hypothetical protein
MRTRGMIGLGLAFSVLTLVAPAGREADTLNPEQTAPQPPAGHAPAPPPLARRSETPRVATTPASTAPRPPAGRAPTPPPPARPEVPLVPPPAPTGPERPAGPAIAKAPARRPATWSAPAISARGRGISLCVPVPGGDPRAARG